MSADPLQCCVTPLPWPTAQQDQTCPDCGTVWEREPVSLGAGTRIKAAHAMTRPAETTDPAAALNQLGTVWSPDFDAYASGQLDASRVRCVLCGYAPCDCPPFGTPGYLALIDARHGRNREGA